MQNAAFKSCSSRVNTTVNSSWSQNTLPPNTHWWCLGNPVIFDVECYGKKRFLVAPSIK